jgi:hypothetical protein
LNVSVDGKRGDEEKDGKHRPLSYTRRAISCVELQ